MVRRNVNEGVCGLTDGADKLVDNRFRLGRQMREQNAVNVDICELFSECRECRIRWIPSHLDTRTCDEDTYACVFLRLLAEARTS